MRRTADSCFGSGRAASTPEPFASASRAAVSAVRSSTSFNPAGLIVIQSDPGILPQAGRFVRPLKRLKH
jgi:hypothetical protein